MLDWIQMISTALSVVQSYKASKNRETTGSTTTTLTEVQRKGWELYLFAQKNEIMSQACNIFSNVALGSLGIRRLRQACYQFLNYLLILTLAIGQTWQSPQERRSPGGVWRGTCRTSIWLGFHLTAFGAGSCLQPIIIAQQEKTVLSSCFQSWTLQGE